MTSRNHRFVASVHQLEAKTEGNFATFYLMNTTRNRNKWGVTKQALEEAVPTVVRKPLGCGPGYKIDKHYEKPMTVGSFVSGDMLSGYALGRAKIDDDFVWEELNARRMGPISVVIVSYRETCSLCGASLMEEFDPHDHACIKTKDAYIKVHSFTFTRVDLVDVPAYPQAGIQKLGSAEEQFSVPLELCASFYESQSNGQAPGSLLNPEEKRKMDKKTIEQLQTQVKELTASVETLKTDNTKLETEKEGLETDKTTLEKKVKELEDPDENPAIKELQDKVEGMEAEKHSNNLTACVEARFKAGLSTDKPADMKVLKAFHNETLHFMTLEAAKVEKRNKDSEPSGPQLQYTEETQTELQAAIKAQRGTYGFPALKAEVAS